MDIDIRLKLGLVNQYLDDQIQGIVKEAFDDAIRNEALDEIATKLEAILSVEKTKMVLTIRTAYCGVFCNVEAILDYINAYIDDHVPNIKLSKVLSDTGEKLLKLTFWDGVTEYWTDIEKVFDDLSNEVDLRLVNLSISASKNVVSILKEATVITTIPVYDEYGKTIGEWVARVKVPFKALKMVGGILKVGGGIVNAINLRSNTIKFRDGELSGGHYAYKTIGTGLTMGATYSLGGPVGITVGGIVYVGDLFYEANEISFMQRQEATEHSRYRIHPSKNAAWYQVEFWKSIWRSASTFMPK
ncbi:hypothetical protein [Aquimarina aquimarini]|uniref:hypothetical protein n=1 Tax=Aquimarina aquimarini TaxID=1191734 RepID=UPI000D5557D5|nr:hypothetical protein [Aquimarina aquimarini]